MSPFNAPDRQIPGRIQTLAFQLKARAFHGVEIPAGQVFSFWRQLGRTTKSKGFTAGREPCSWKQRRLPDHPLLHTLSSPDAEALRIVLRAVLQPADPACAAS